MMMMMMMRQKRDGRETQSLINHVRVLKIKH